MRLGRGLGRLLAWLFGGKSIGRSAYGFEMIVCPRLIPNWAAAQTFADIVLIKPGYERSDRLLSHEAVHVRQWRQWGWLFPMLYIGASLLAALRYGLRQGYAMNAFEVEARRLEKKG